MKNKLPARIPLPKDDLTSKATNSRVKVGAYFTLACCLIAIATYFGTITWLWKYLSLYIDYLLITIIAATAPLTTILFGIMKIQDSWQFTGQWTYVLVPVQRGQQAPIREEPVIGHFTIKWSWKHNLLSIKEGHSFRHLNEKYCHYGRWFGTCIIDKDKESMALLFDFLIGELEKSDADHREDWKGVIHVCENQDEKGEYIGKYNDFVPRNHYSGVIACKKTKHNWKTTCAQLIPPTERLVDNYRQVFAN